jgi:hypothetical protein
LSFAYVSLFMRNHFDGYVSIYSMLIQHSDCISVIMDYCRKMAKFIPYAQTVNAAQLIQLLFDNAWCNFGLPSSVNFGLPSNVISDGDSRFTGDFWKSPWKLSGTQINSLPSNG